MELTPNVTAGIAEYIGLTDDIITGLRDKVASLEADLSTGSQKEAALEPTPALDGDAVKTTVSNIINAGFLKKADQDQAIACITRDPASLLEFLDKLANKSIQNRQVPKIGSSVVEKTASRGHRESDASYEATFSRLSHQL